MHFSHLEFFREIRQLYFCDWCKDNIFSKFITAVKVLTDFSASTRRISCCDNRLYNRLNFLFWNHISYTTTLQLMWVRPLIIIVPLRWIVRDADKRWQRGVWVFIRLLLNFMVMTPEIPGDCDLYVLLQPADNGLCRCGWMYALVYQVLREALRHGRPSILDIYHARCFSKVCFPDCSLLEKVIQLGITTG